MGMLVEHHPPQKKLYSLDYTRHRIYLAGSTQGVNWQQQFIETMNDLPIDVFNPRNPTNNFGWEMDHMSIATVIALYFDPQDTSANGLLTLGMFSKTDRLIVCCPKEFYKKSDVDLICDREDIHQVDTLDLLIAHTVARIAPQSTFRKIIANLP